MTDRLLEIALHWRQAPETPAKAVGDAFAMRDAQQLCLPALALLHLQHMQGTAVTLESWSQQLRAEMGAVLDALLLEDFDDVTVAGATARFHETHARRALVSPSYTEAITRLRECLARRVALYSEDGAELADRCEHYFGLLWSVPAPPEPTEHDGHDRDEPTDPDNLFQSPREEFLPSSSSAARGRVCARCSCVWPWAIAADSCLVCNTMSL